MADGLPFLVGESPSRTGDRYWRFPLSGAPARTLCRAAGWEPDGPPAEPGSWTWALYARFDTVNVFTRYADATPWSAPAARERAVELRRQMRASGATRAVLLGRRVAEAFAVGSEAYFSWVRVGGFDVVVLPHPSGRNRLLNDPVTRVALGRTLREAVDAGSVYAP